MKTWLETETRPALVLSGPFADGYDYKALVERWLAKRWMRFLPPAADIDKLYHRLRQERMRQSRYARGQNSFGQPRKNLL